MGNFIPRLVTRFTCGVGLVTQQATLAVYGAAIGTAFQVWQDQSSSVVLRLSDVDERGSTPRQERFSLLFHGPLQPFLPQQTYHMEHETLGELALFLVPVGQDETGFTYEAVINRLAAEDRS